jgi:Tol biopolymer transport system component
MIRIRVRILLLAAIFSIIWWIAAAPLAATLAQSEPTAIVDAALRDLSQHLGRTLTRGTVDNWTWEQIDFPDASLGCPQPGQTYAQAVTRGYKLTFIVNGTAYDYRATNNGQVLFLCRNAPPAAAPTSQTVNTTPTAAPTLPAPVATTFQKALTYVGPDGNVYISGIGQGAGMALTSDAGGTQIQTPPFFKFDHVYGQFRWSPDGTKLLYTDLSNGTLWLVISGQKPLRIASGIPQYPGAWSPDGSEIAYAVETKQPQGTGFVRQVQAVPVTPTGIGGPRVAGSFVEVVGCGGGTADPGQFMYSVETGFGGNELTMDWIQQGFVYSTACSGVGLALASSNGQVIWNIGDVGRAVISSDHSRIVAIQGIDRNQNKLVTVDLSNGTVTPISSEANPDHAVWSADGQSIVYSTQAPQPATDATFPDVEKVFGINNFAAVNNLASLWQIPVGGGQSVQLFQSLGYAIGLISPAPDKSVIAFSFINSAAQMVQQLNNRSPLNQAITFAPRPRVYSLVLNTNTPPVLLSIGGKPSFSTASFVAVPAASGGITPQPAQPTQPTQAPQPTQPLPTAQTQSNNTGGPNLVVGGRAMVTTPAGNPLNLRKTPGLTAPVLGILKPGAVVTIVAGPQFADNLRWWQVKASDDAVPGWVVDQVTDATGTTTTLTPQP